MGCDIHMYCEVKKKDSNNWSTVGRIFKNSYSEINKNLITIDEEGYSWGEAYTFHPYNNRNYDLFGILADVRNGTWGEPIKPISSPRGLPNDVSKFVKKESEDYGEDAHSHTYINLEELEKYDWKQKIKMCASVSKKQIKDYKEKGIIPTLYVAYSSAGEQLEWETELEQKDFVNNIIPKLQSLKEYGEVRIVFWFDN